MAKYYAIPMLSIPLNDDEWTNVKAIQRENWTMSVDYHSLSESILREKINELVSNPMYDANIKQYSAIFCKQMDDSLRETLSFIDNVQREAIDDTPMDDDTTYRTLLINLKYAFGLIFAILCFYFAFWWFRASKPRSDYQQLR